MFEFFVVSFSYFVEFSLTGEGMILFLFFSLGVFIIRLALNSGGVLLVDLKGALIC